MRFVEGFRAAPPFKVWQRARPPALNDGAGVVIVRDGHGLHWVVIDGANGCDRNPNRQREIASPRAGDGVKDGLGDGDAGSRASVRQAVDGSNAHLA
jgi:hypothetical protein